MEMLTAITDRELLLVLGGRIRERLEAQGLTQQWLAERLGCSAAAVGNWMVGRRDMGVSTLVRITSLLQIAPTDLLPATSIPRPAAPAGP